MLLVLAKALAPAEFGILAIAALTYNISSAVNEMGVADALTYLQDRIEETTRTALTLVLAAGLVLMALTWAFAPIVASFFHSPHATFVIRGFAVCLPFDASAQVPIGRLTRTLSFRRRAVTDSLPSVVGGVVTIAVVVGGYPLIGLVAGQIAGSVANAVIAFFLGPRCLPGWNSVRARQLLNYGGYLTAANLINFGLLNVDYIVVGHVLGPVALGLYSLAYRICFMPYLAIAVVANGAVFPYYCRLPSREAIGRASESTISLINAIIIPWFAGMILFADYIVLLGSKWAPAAGAVRFLAVYGFFLSLILEYPSGPQGSRSHQSGIRRTRVAHGYADGRADRDGARRHYDSRLGPGPGGGGNRRPYLPVDSPLRVGATPCAVQNCRSAVAWRSRNDLRRLPGPAHPWCEQESLLGLPAAPRLAGDGRFRSHSACGYARASPERMGGPAWA